MTKNQHNNKHYFLPYDQLQNLIDTLVTAGYQVIGPQTNGDNILFKELTKAEQLPWGYRDQQQPGQYRLHKTDERKAFMWVSGAQALKPLLFKARESIWRVIRDAAGKLQFKPTQLPEKPMAVFGVRACDIHAMLIQDKTFIHDKFQDPLYQARRKNLFVIAMNCTRSASTCFCVSAGGYPAAKDNFDLAMTEIDNGYTIIDGSDRGADILQQLNLIVATKEQMETVHRGISNAVEQQTRTLPLNNSRDLRDALFNNLEHPRYDDVADRCLSCTNCTMVCPTCFCHAEHDEANMDGAEVNHVKQWDSCFTAGHSYVAGRVLRDDTRKRYRQWLTHKLGSWHDQFDTSGCVGCGRCITWCPVGIDITEEAHAICDKSQDDNKHE